MEKINVNGYNWFLYTEPIEMLNSEDVNNIIQNAITIKTLLNENGYTIENLHTISVSKSTPYIEVFDILQKIEYNLDILNTAEIKTPFYNEPKKIGEYASNKEDVWRWIQILNDLFEILTNQKGEWGVLLCTDGFPTINGKTLLVRGDTLG